MSCNPEIQALRDKLAQLEEIERLKKRIRDLECKPYQPYTTCCGCCSTCNCWCQHRVYGPIVYPTITWGTTGTISCPSNTTFTTSANSMEKNSEVSRF